MTGAPVSPASALQPFAKGRGVQFVRFGRLLPAVPVQPETGPLDAPDGSLDFVVSGPEWWGHDAPLVLLAEWRRCLRPGGRIAVLSDAPARLCLVQLRLLAGECGLKMDEPLPLSDDLVLLAGTRSIEGTVRRLFGGIAAEVSRSDRPATWRCEFFFDLGGVLLQAGEGRKAADCFATVLAEDPESLEARVGVAMAMALLAEWDEAEEILTGVLRSDPHHGLAADWLRRCRQRGADDEAATGGKVLRPASPRPGRVRPRPR